MEESAMQQGSTGLRRPPQITLALDRDKCVLYVNRDLAGTGFDKLADEPGARLHSLVHPDCDSDCRFNRLLKKAWKSLNTKRESVEWEIDDPVLKRHFRINLSRPPTPNGVTVERRRRFALLTLTDITEIRREYESVLSSNRELQRKLDQLAAAARPAANDALQTAQPAPFSGKIVAAQERERRRIAADLHDGVAQTMGAVKYSVESRIADLKNRYPELELADFELVVDKIREAIEDLRKISRNLSPSMLNEFGVCTAIDMLCSEFAAELPNVEVICAACVNEIRLPEAIKVAIYRVVQEALNNIGKHADAQNIRVALLAEDTVLSLEISDDGNGFEPAAMPTKSARGLGLDSMRERVELTGGEFEITSAMGKGTIIHAAWPDAVLDLLGDEPVLDRENGHG